MIGRLACALAGLWGWLRRPLSIPTLGHDYVEVASDPNTSTLVCERCRHRVVHWRYTPP